MTMNTAMIDFFNQYPIWTIIIAITTAIILAIITQYIYPYIKQSGEDVERR